MSVLTGTIQHRRGTAAQWSAANPLLLAGEKGLETDTGLEKNGDGATLWNALGYSGGGSSQTTGIISGGAISIGVFGVNNVRVAAAVWYITGFGTFSTSVDNDFTSAVAAAGLFRHDGFYGKNDGTIIKVTGAESSAAAFPATPADHALIGYVLVSDASVGTTPDLSGYLLKADKASPAEVLAGTADNVYITPKGLTDSGVLGAGFATQVYVDAKRFATLRFHGASIGWADSTTYFYAETNNGIPLPTTGREIELPFDCTAIVFTMECYNNGTIGSAENITVRLRNTTTATNYDLTTTLQTNAGAQNKSGAMAFVGSATNKVEVQVIVPPMATNPSAVLFSAQVTFIK